MTGVTQALGRVILTDQTPPATWQDQNKHNTIVVNFSDRFQGSDGQPITDRHKTHSYFDQMIHKLEQAVESGMNLVINVKDQGLAALQQQAPDTHNFIVHRLGTLLHTAQAQSAMEQQQVAQAQQQALQAQLAQQQAQQAQSAGQKNAAQPKGKAGKQKKQSNFLFKMLNPFNWIKWGFKLATAPIRLLGKLLPGGNNKQKQQQAAQKA